MLYSDIIKKYKHMKTFKVEETVLKTVKRIYFVDAEDEEAQVIVFTREELITFAAELADRVISKCKEAVVHRVMSHQKDVDEEDEIDEEVTDYKVKKYKFK